MKRPPVRQMPKRTKTMSAIRSFIMVGVMAVLLLLLLEPSRTTSAGMTGIGE